MIRSDFGCYMLVSLVVSVGPVLAGTTSTTKSCGKKMTCAEPSTWHSEPPPPISFAADARSVPRNCTALGIGTIARADVPACEAFAKSDNGTPRQRAVAWVNMGHQYLLSKDMMSFSNPQHTFRAWDNAIATDPTFAEPWVTKGDVLAWEFDTRERSIPLYQKALEIEPTHWRAMLGLARALVWSDRRTEALTIAERAMFVAPSSSIVHQLYGAILDRAGDVDLAREEYLKATTAAGSEDDIRLPGGLQEESPWVALADLERRQGRYAEAATAVSHLIDGKTLSLSDARFLSMRGEIYEAWGKALDAAKDYEGALAIGGAGFPDAEQLQSRAAILRASVVPSNNVAGIFRSIARDGKLQSILRLQIFLRSRGFEIAIDGKPGSVLETTLDQCLSDTACKEALGQPI